MSNFGSNGTFYNDIPLRIRRREQRIDWERIFNVMCEIHERGVCMRQSNIRLLMSSEQIQLSNQIDNEILFDSKLIFNSSECSDLTTNFIEQMKYTNDIVGLKVDFIKEIVKRKTRYTGEIPVYIFELLLSVNDSYEFFNLISVLVNGILRTKPFQRAVFKKICFGDDRDNDEYSH